MKFKDLTKNISIFILAVLIIAVYKTFDSIGIVFGYIGRFFRLLIPVFIAFAINYAAYFAEIYRGGIESMSVGQYEAAKILGYN